MPLDNALSLQCARYGGPAGVKPGGPGASFMHMLDATRGLGEDEEAGRGHTEGEGGRTPERGEWWSPPVACVEPPTDAFHREANGWWREDDAQPGDRGRGEEPVGRCQDAKGADAGTEEDGSQTGEDGVRLTLQAEGILGGGDSEGDQGLPEDLNHDLEEDAADRLNNYSQHSRPGTESPRVASNGQR